MNVSFIVQCLMFLMCVLVTDNPIVIGLLALFLFFGEDLQFYLIDKKTHDEDD